jgi:hypothetical protein
MKRMLLVIMAILSASVVLAEQMDAFVGQSTSLSTACIRNSQLRGDANATIIIYYANGTVLVSKTNMTHSGNGTLQFTYTFNEIGSYTTRETCDFGDYLADGSTLITVMKPGFGSMQVIAQGTAQVALGATAVSEWLVLLPNSTNQTASNLTVTGGVCGVEMLNGTALNATVNVVTSVDKLTATTVTDSANGFTEGTNYQMLCNMTLTNGLYVNGIKNYVYINEHVSFLQYILQLLGLAQSTSATANQTLNITNQTLQIVQGLNLTGTTRQRISAVVAG